MKREGASARVFPLLFGRRAGVVFLLVSDLLFASLLCFFPDPVPYGIFPLAALALFFSLPSRGRAAVRLFLWGFLLLSAVALARLFPLSLPAVGMAVWLAVSFWAFFRYPGTKENFFSRWGEGLLTVFAALFFLWRSTGNVLPDMVLLYVMSFTALFCFGISHFFA